MRYFEQIVWIFALGFLFFMNVDGSSASFCLFKSVGFSSCPGCGIGHAIHYALHFNFTQSISEHIFGIPATIGILYTIVKPLLKPNKTYSNGSR